MKKISAIWGIICYPILYIAMQFVVSVIYTTILGLVVGFNVGLQNPDALTAMTPEEMGTLIMSRVNLQIPLLLSAILVFFIMFLILKNHWKQTNFWKTGGLNPQRVLICAATGIALNLFTIGAISLTNLTDLSPNYEDLINLIMDGGIAFQILNVAVLFPFLEEIIFRGAVFERIKKLSGPAFAIVLQAAVFGFIHFNLLQGMYAFLLGVIICLIFLWYDSIWAAVTIHISYNLTSVVLSNVLGEADISSLALAFMTLFGGAVCAAGLVLARKGRRPNTQESAAYSADE